MRRILHIDMDAFFASVEELRYPDLRDKPVVVGGSGDPRKRGVVSTANYRAREYGIRSAMPLRTAHRLCPHAVFLPVNHEIYSRISKQIKEILRGYSPIMQDLGIDEAFLDISGNPLSSEELARKIKEHVYRETGLTCSIGIAPNKLVAKIASDLRKPDGITVVPDREVEKVLSALPVRKLRGIGPKTASRLQQLGIQTIEELRALPLDRLVEQFGRVHGAYLYEASRGIDDRPVVTERQRKSIGRETTFQSDLSDWQEIARSLADLTKLVVTRMEAKGAECRTVTVKIRYSDFSTHTRSFTFSEPEHSLDRIREAAFSDLGRFDLKGRRIRLIGVRVENLVMPNTA